MKQFQPMKWLHLDLTVDTTGHVVPEIAIMQNKRTCNKSKWLKH